ncbi:MAG: AAA family ATPase, partial [Thaumarchaeota archaeon]|nr:AAA family ATPase [Nitrososphaerota archaeon]
MQETDNVLNIPTELMQFVERDTYSLLIKGYAGTGKTTLALTILKALNIKENFQYLSTRISPTQLYQYYPWLAEFFGNSKEAQISDVSENGQGMPIFVDARLDEPSSMFERITNQLMDMKSPVIIIDSWDAVGYFMDREALMNNARVLQTWRERAKAKMIFISEEPTNTTVDVLIDGIVE